MSPEEYERIKEAEKAHLRSLRRLKGAVRALKRKQSVSDALSRLTGAQQSLDDNEDLVDRLAQETAHYEARLDVAFDSARDRADEVDEKAEAAARQRRARQLLRQLKQELGVDPGDADMAGDALTGRAPTQAGDAARSAAPPDDTPRGDDLPDKTIGRMPRDDR